MSNLKRNLIGMYDLVNNATLGKKITWRAARKNYAQMEPRVTSEISTSANLGDRNAEGLPLINPHMITYSNGAALVLVPLRLKMRNATKTAVQLKSGGAGCNNNNKPRQPLVRHRSLLDGKLAVMQWCSNNLRTAFHKRGDWAIAIVKNPAR